MDTNRNPHIGPWHIVVPIAVVLAGVLFILNSCIPRHPGTGEGTPLPYIINTGAEGPGGRETGGTGEEYGVEVDMSEGQAQLQTPLPLPVATGEPLPPEEVEGIFVRLPALPFSPDEQMEFKYPVVLLPPPYLVRAFFR